MGKEEPGRGIETATERRRRNCRDRCADVLAQDGREGVEREEEEGGDWAAFSFDAGGALLNAFSRRTCVPFFESLLAPAFEGDPLFFDLAATSRGPGTAPRGGMLKISK